jgi:hypothetical protein
MEFGDLILNTCAGKINPGRISIFIKTDGTFIHTITRKGSRLRFHISEQKKDNFLKVIGHISFEAWDKAIGQDKSS